MAKKRGRPKKETVTETKPKTAFEETMGKKIDSQGRVRATVLTRAASEIADESRKKGRPNSKYFNSDCIHRPKD